MFLKNCWYVAGWDYEVTPNCLLEWAEVMGNTAFEYFDGLSDSDKSVLMIDMVERVREARVEIRECMEISRPSNSST